jgi:glycoside transferase family 14
MKHAYLILAHGSYALLQRLVSAIDDERNDIFIHVDRKQKDLPHLKVKRSRLFLLNKERVSVFWGDVSVVAAEFALMAFAYKQDEYAYYHLLSGVDLPLKSQNYIHDFFETQKGKEFIGFYDGADLSASLVRKVQRYHLFAQDFRGSGLVFLAKRILRACAIRIQELLGIKRHPNIRFAKGTQWWSLTGALIEQLLSKQDEILSLYKHTFCADEIAIQTYVYNSPFMAQVFAPEDEAKSSLRHIGWREGALYDWTRADYEDLKRSTALFARKFNEEDPDFLDSIIELSHDK